MSVDELRDAVIERDRWRAWALATIADLNEWAQRHGAHYLNCDCPGCGRRRLMTGTPTCEKCGWEPERADEERGGACGACCGDGWQRQQLDDGTLRHGPMKCPTCNGTGRAGGGS